LQTTKQGGPGKQSLFSSAKKIIQVLNVKVIGILSTESSLGKQTDRQCKFMKYIGKNVFDVESEESYKEANCFVAISDL